MRRAAMMADAGWEAAQLCAILSLALIDNRFVAGDSFPLMRNEWMCVRVGWWLSIVIKLNNLSYERPYEMEHTTAYEMSNCRKLPSVGNMCGCVCVSAITRKNLHTKLCEQYVKLHCGEKNAPSGTIKAGNMAMCVCVCVVCRQGIDAECTDPCNIWDNRAIEIRRSFIGFTHTHILAGQKTHTTFSPWIPLKCDTCGSWQN